jgi:hypothetical protein
MTPREEAALAVMKEQLERQGEEIEELLRIVKGHNNTPGILQRIAIVDERISSLASTESRCPIWQVQLDMYGDPKDRDKNPGVMWILADHERWKKNFERVYWLALGAIVVGVVDIVIRLATTFVKP